MVQRDGFCGIAPLQRPPLRSLDGTWRAVMTRFTTDREHRAVHTCIRLWHSGMQFCTGGRNFSLVDAIRHS
jgi:hypothetical protein